jgi:hypothetical protein
MFAKYEIARGNIEPTVEMWVLYRRAQGILIGCTQATAPMENLKSVSIVIKDD